MTLNIKCSEESYIVGY